MREIPLRDWGNLRRDGEYILEVRRLFTPGDKIAVVFWEEENAFPAAVRVIREFKGLPYGTSLLFDGTPLPGQPDDAFVNFECFHGLPGDLLTVCARCVPLNARSYEEALAEIEAEAAEEAKDVPLMDWGDLDPGFRYHLEVQMLPDPERFAVLFRKVKLGAVEGVRLVDRGVGRFDTRKEKFIKDPQCVAMDRGFPSKVCLDFDTGSDHPYRFLSAKAPALEEARAEWAAEKPKEAPEATKDHQPEPAPASTQNHPVNVPLCDWGALNRGKAYDLERHDISERELAVVFRERGSGDVVAVRVVNPKPHGFYGTAVEPDHLARFDRSLCDVDFFCQGGAPVTCRRVSLDAPSLAQLAMRNQLPDPKDETRWAYTKPELLPGSSEDQKIAGFNVAHVIEDEVQHMPPKAAEEIRGQIYGQRISATDFDRDSVLEAITSPMGRRHALWRQYALWRQEISESINRTILNKPAPGPAISEEALAEKLCEVVRAELAGIQVKITPELPADWQGDFCVSDSHFGGDFTVTQKPTDLDAVKEIVEAVVHESTMDNSRSAANLQQHLCRIENTQAAMESELLKVSNFLTSLQESSVGLAGAMQDMADSGAALCDTVGARLSPIEAAAGGVQSNQEALAKLSSDIEDFLGEVREQIVHLEEKIEDVQDAVWYRQADAWPDEEAVAQLRAEHPAALHFPVWQAYRIESSGGPHNTRVIDLSTGEEIKAKSVTWSVDANRLPTARIEVYNAALSVDLPKDQVELHELPLPSGYPVLEESKEEATPNVIPEPDAAVNKSRFFSMEWRSDSQAKASGRGAMWLMAALLFGALIGGMLMNMFPLWHSASSGLSSWSAPAPSPRPAPAPSIQAKAAFPAKQEKSSSLLCR